MARFLERALLPDKTLNAKALPAGSVGSLTVSDGAARLGKEGRFASADGGSKPAAPCLLTALTAVQGVCSVLKLT